LLACRDGTIHTETITALTRGNAHIGRAAAFAVGFFNRDASAFCLVALLCCAFILIVITGAQCRTAAHALTVSIAMIVAGAIQAVVACALIRGVVLNATAFRVVTGLESARIARIRTSHKVSSLADTRLTDGSRCTGFSIVARHAIVHGLKTTRAVGTNTRLASRGWTVRIDGTWARVITNACPIISAGIFFGAFVIVIA